MKTFFFDVAPRNVDGGCGKGVLKFSDIENAAQLFYDPNFPVFYPRLLARSHLWQVKFA